MDKVKEPQSLTIRYPATANLMVDSKDRKTGTWGNFQIQKPQALLNGFFHRIGTTEVVLEWGQPNVNSYNGQVTVVVGGTNYTVEITYGFHTVESAFASLTALLDTATGDTWTVVVVEGVQSLGCENAGLPVDFDVLDTPMARKLSIYDPAFDGAPSRPIYAPDLRLYRYLDIVCTQLTYNQDLKDASTAPVSRDVLCRWYMAYDNQTATDGLGFPILMGYEPFVLRRIFSPPKQIRWDNIQPIGNLAFEVYDDQGVLLSSDQFNNYLMTLQVSEN